MTTVTDDFNRASGAFGANWSADTGTAGTDTGAPVAAANGGWRIYNNALVFDTSTRSDTFCLRWVGTALASNDYYVQAVIDKASDNDNAPGVLGRKAAGTGDGNSDGYAFYPYSDTYWLVELTDSAESTTLGTYGTTDAVAHTLRITCNGSRISGDIDGTERIAVTGETTWASGGVGLAIGAYAAADASTWDNFEAADLGGSPDTRDGRSILTMQASGADVAGFVDSGRSVLTLNATGADIAGFVDSGRSVCGLTCSGADIMIFVDTGQSVMELTASATDTAAFVDGGTAVIEFGASGADVFAGVETGRSVLELQASGAADDGGGTTETDSGRSVLTMTAGGEDAFIGVDDGLSVVGLTVSVTDAPAYADDGVSVAGLLASGADVAVFVDDGRGVLELAPFGADIFAGVDSGRSLFEMVASGSYYEGSQGDAAKIQYVRQKAREVGQDSATVRGRARKVG